MSLVDGFEPPGEWVDSAACGMVLNAKDPAPGYDPELWSEEGRGEEADARRQLAVLVCMGCPVRSECLNDALDRQEPDGVWGGFTEKERRRMLGLRRWPRKNLPPEHGTSAREKWDRRHGVQPCEECLRATARKSRESERRRERRREQRAARKAKAEAAA